MIEQFLLKLSNLKCPNCAALQDWSTATKTVPWMTESNADQIPSFEYATCKMHLRFKNDHSTILFTACFVAGMLTLAGFLSWIGNGALGDGLTVQFGVLLFVLWLLLGSIVLWTSARLLELEIAECNSLHT